MKSVIIFICFIFISNLKLKAIDSDNFETLGNLILQIENEGVIHKSKAEIICVFYNCLSSAFNLGITASSTKSSLKIDHDDTSNEFDCNNEGDVQKILSFIDICSNKIDSILRINGINSELEYYLCDFLISKIDKVSNSRLYENKELGKLSDREYDFEYQINNNNEYEISWIRSIPCSTSKNTIKRGDIIQSINSIPSRYLTNSLVKSLLITNDSIEMAFSSDSILKCEIFKPHKIKFSVPFSLTQIDRKVAYLKINTFLVQGITEQISNRLYKSKAERIIIDIRNNVGGYFQEIGRFIGLFLGPNDTIAIFKSDNCNRKITMYNFR